MTQNDLTRAEKACAGAIKKIKQLNKIEPEQSWVSYCRADLELRMNIERKKEILGQDLFTLQGLFSFVREWRQPKYYRKLAYAFSSFVLLFLAGGSLTVWASMKSMPGSLLYPIKIRLEKARIMVSSEQGKIRLQGENTTRRLQELQVVVKSETTVKEKSEKVKTVVEHLQQQLISDKERLPQVVSKNESDNVAIAAKEVGERAEQVKKAIIEAKDSLSSEISSGLSEKLDEVAEAADKTTMQALEAIVNKPDKTEADIKELSVKFETIISEKESAIAELKSATSLSATASSTVAKLPVNISAVLINQADEAQDLLSKVEESLLESNFSAAIETLKILTEIVKGAEKISKTAETQGVLPVNSEGDTNNSTSSESVAPLK